MVVSIRDAIEQTIKDFSLDRLCFHEVSKVSYGLILEKIEKAFVSRGGTLHWAGLQDRFRPDLPCRAISMGDRPLWFEQLPGILPQPELPFYALFEDRGRQRPKYWVYEAHVKELIVILRETPGIADYDLVSKKMDWLVSECHEDVVHFVGGSLHPDPFVQSCTEGNSRFRVK